MGESTISEVGDEQRLRQASDSDTDTRENEDEPKPLNQVSKAKRFFDGLANNTPAPPSIQQRQSYNVDIKPVIETGKNIQRAQDAFREKAITDLDRHDIRRLAHLDEYQHSSPVPLALFLMIFFIVGMVVLRFTRSSAEPKKRSRKAKTMKTEERNSRS